MNKMILAGILLFLAACASNTPSADMNANSPRVVYLNESDRNPASAPDLKWTSAEIRFDVRSSSEQKSYQVEVQQVMSWPEQESFTNHRNEYQEIEVAYTCADLQCSSGTGTSALWNKYFSAPSHQKADTLANAIKGIGEVSAKALVKNRYFSSKPRNWSEFSAEINRAANAGVIKKSVATEVIYNYRIENAANLGYSSNSCREVKNTCTAWVSKLESVPFTDYRTVTKTRVVDNRRFDVDVDVKDAKLLSNEKDVIQFSINENGQVLSATSVSGFNRYDFKSNKDENGHILVEAKSIQRILRDLPGNVVQKDSFTLVGNQPTFVLDVDSTYIPGEEDPGAQLVADYKIQICEYGWTGTCGLSSWKDHKMGSIELKQARTLINVDVPPKHKAQIVYQITRRNSGFFSNRSISERDTDNISMPK